MTAPLLDVENLRVASRRRTGVVEAVRGVSLHARPREARHRRRDRLGQVDDRPRDPAADAAAGRGHAPSALRFDGIDLLTACRSARCATLRGARISMVMQDPKFSLNPVMTVGRQIAEAYRVAPQRLPRARRARAALEMLEAVRIRDPERVYDALSARGLGRHGPAGDDRDDAGRPSPTC